MLFFSEIKIIFIQTYVYVEMNEIEEKRPTINRLSLFRQESLSHSKALQNNMMNPVREMILAKITFVTRREIIIVLKQWKITLKIMITLIS